MAQEDSGGSASEGEGEGEGEGEAEQDVSEQHGHFVHSKAPESATRGGRRPESARPGREGALVAAAPDLSSRLMAAGGDSAALAARDDGGGGGGGGGAGSGDEEKRVEDGELCLGLRDASLLGPSSPVREDDANAAEAGEGGVWGLGVM